MGLFQSLDLSINDLEAARLAILKRDGSYFDLTNANPLTALHEHVPKIGFEKVAAQYFQTHTYTPHPQGSLAAREAIHRYYQKRWGTLAPAPQNIFLTASTSEAYRLLFSILCEPGDNVLVPNPSYPLFDLIAADQRILLQNYPLEVLDTGILHPEEITTHINRYDSKALVIVSPHNPTGQTVEKLSTIGSPLTVPIIVDEVFSEFLYFQKPGGVNLPNRNDCAIFILNGLSKMFACPDLKLSWICLNDVAQDLFGKQLEILNDTYLSASSLSQALVPELFKQGSSIPSVLREIYSSNIDALLEALVDIPGLTLQKPRGGAFLFPTYSQEIDEEAFCLSLLDRGFYTHPGYFYGDLPAKHFFLSAVHDPKALATVLPKLREALIAILR